MKKVLLIAAFAVVGLLSVNAQENDNKSDFDEVVEMAKGGGFYVGANIGLH